MPRGGFFWHFSFEQKTPLFYKKLLMELPLVSEEICHMVWGRDYDSKFNLWAFLRHTKLVACFGDLHHLLQSKMFLPLQKWWAQGFPSFLRISTSHGNHLMEDFRIASMNCHSELLCPQWVFFYPWLTLNTVQAFVSQLVDFTSKHPDKTGSWSGKPGAGLLCTCFCTNGRCETKAYILRSVSRWKMNKDSWGIINCIIRIIYSLVSFHWSTFFNRRVVGKKWKGRKKACTRGAISSRTVLGR